MGNPGYLDQWPCSYAQQRAWNGKTTVTSGLQKDGTKSKDPYLYSIQGLWAGQVT